ncbi:MAG: hypothetical protein HOY79_41130, partial [Streptomyces sp.]|nr:hypothetical protein [Streptomyces sp.]
MTISKSHTLWDSAVFITRTYNRFDTVVDEPLPPLVGHRLISPALLERDPEQYWHTMRVAHEIHLHGGPRQGTVQGVELARKLARARREGATLDSLLGTGGQRPSQAPAGASAVQGEDGHPPQALVFPAADPVRPEQWRHRRADAFASELWTERFDPEQGRPAGDGTLPGSSTLIRAWVRRIQAEDGRWVRNLNLHLPVRFGEGFHQDMLPRYEARWRQALDDHFNTGLRLPRSGDQLHIDLNLSHVPDHPEAIELSTSPEPGRSDQLHFRMHSEDPSLAPAELARRRHLNDLLGLHEFGHFTGLPDTYYAPDSLFRNTAGKSSSSGIMADVVEAPSPGVPKEYLAAIENAVDSGPVVRDHSLTDPSSTTARTKGARQTPGDPAEHQRFGRFRDELKSLVVRPHPDPEQLRQSIGAFLDGVAPQHRAAWVRETRQLIDTLPDTQYTDESVNAAHRALNTFDTYRSTLAVPGAQYVSASRVTAPRGAGFVRRDIPEVVVIDGEPYATVYSTVYGDELGAAKPQHKDVGLDANGVVQIHTGTPKYDPKKPTESVFWVSIGQPLRQIKWIDKYKAQGATEPMIRSFLVPLRVANEISRGAVTEHHAGDSAYGPGEIMDDFNVDKPYASNQFGIRDLRSLELLRRTALPHSVRTYTDGPTQGRPDSWGDVRALGELRGRLGVPNEGMPGNPVFTEGDKFVGPAMNEAIARTLREIVAAHYNTPGLREPGDKYLSRKQVEAYFDRHAPEHLKNGIADR